MIDPNTHLGLNPWAQNFVTGGRAGKLDCLVTKHPDGAVDVEIRNAIRFIGPCAKKVQSTRTYLDRYNERHFLNDFFFPDGKIFHEVLQLDLDHGSPYCTALQDKYGRWIEESLWNPQDVGSTLSLPRTQFVRSINSGT